MIERYVKKPIPIEAVQWLGTNAEEIMEFCPLDAVIDSGKLYIKTLEGDMNAHVGDYIIKGIHGEFYPCARQIFEESYEVYIE